MHILQIQNISIIIIIIIIIKTINAGPRGETKLFICFLGNSTSTCTTENWKIHCYMYELGTIIIIYINYVRLLYRN